MKVLHSFFFILFTSCMFGQTNQDSSQNYTDVVVDSISIFFRYNDSKIVVSENLKNTLVQQIKDGLNFKLVGYSDTSGISVYNLWLSEERIKNTFNYIKTLVSTEQPIIVQNAIGERHSIKNSALARRVDVLVFRRNYFEIIKMDTIVPEVKVIAVDTTVQVMRIRQVKKQILNIMFVPDKATILNESLPEVEKLFQTISSLADYKIELHGHVCCGNEKRLSKRRAKTIKKILIKKGISKKRIKVFGHGNEQPITEERTEEEKAQNRRVEAIYKPILKKEKKKKKTKKEANE
jgi:outer membrane protein OmpA-like peptidoglycan-associated protein